MGLASRRVVVVALLVAVGCDRPAASSGSTASAVEHEQVPPVPRPMPAPASPPVAPALADATPVDAPESKPPAAAPDIEAWRAEPEPGPEASGSWAWGKIVLAKAGKRVATSDREALAILPALERGLLQCTSISADPPPATSPPARIEVYFRGSPLNLPIVPGTVAAWEIGLDLGVDRIEPIVVATSEGRIALSGCETCDLYATSLRRWLPTGPREACDRRAATRRGWPRTVDLRHARSSWVVYLAAVEQMTDPALAKARRDAAALGYDARIGNTACDSSNFEAGNNEYMAGVHFANRADAERFVQQAKLRPLYVGKVETGCMD